MEIIEIDPKQLKPAEYNPRKMTEKQVRDLTESVRRFGLVDPIIVNNRSGRENVVVGGHQRLKIAILEGFEAVPVVYVNLDEKSERELNLRLNRNLGEWDWDMLANFDAEELLNVGFSSQELDKFLDLKEDDFDANKEYQAIQEPQTKLGDLWQVGEHRLLCGDSTQKASYEAILGQEKATLVFTDPPYNVGYDYDWRSPLDKGKKIAHRFFNDKKTDEEYREFIASCFLNAFNFTTYDANFYCWYASKFHAIVERGLKEAGWKISQQIIWMKNYPVLSSGQDFHRTFEPCLHGWKKQNKHFYNKLGNLRDIINWDDFQSNFDMWFENRDKLNDYKHPTQKPIKLAERAIKKSSKENDIVMDFFGGSGSTLIACEQLKRKAYLIELDPIYCDVIIKRWELFTGKKAEKVI